MLKKSARYNILFQSEIDVFTNIFNSIDWKTMNLGDIHSGQQDSLLQGSGSLIYFGKLIPRFAIKIVIHAIDCIINK